MFGIIQVLIHPPRPPGQTNFIWLTPPNTIGIFVDHWAPTFLILGLYNKLVKQLGSIEPKMSSKANERIPILICADEQKHLLHYPVVVLMLIVLNCSACSKSWLHW